MITVFKRDKSIFICFTDNKYWTKLSPQVGELCLGLNNTEAECAMIVGVVKATPQVSHAPVEEGGEVPFRDPDLLHLKESAVALF